MGSHTAMTTDDAPFSNADLFAYHKATGCPLTKAEEELLKLEPELRSRVFKAALEQPGNWGRLCDPIEHDPALRELVRAAASAAEMLAGPPTPARPMPSYLDRAETYPG